MKRRARLDHDGVYFGFDDVEDLKEGEVDAGDGDLRLGAYRWIAADEKTGAVGHFAPLPPSQVRAAADGPDAERATYELAVALHQFNAATVPEAVITWAIGYERSFDADNGRRFDYFRILKGS